ncbi:MAG: leucyl aminopeptidase [Elainellaceae cyanobacterium]
MNVKGIEISRADWRGDCLAVGLFDGQPIEGELAELDRAIAGTLSELVAEAEFTGKTESTAVTRVGGGSTIRKIAVVGLGPEENLSLEVLRRGAAAAARIAHQEKCAKLGLSFPVWKADKSLTTQALVEGVELACHQDTRFKSEPQDKAFHPETVELLGLAGQQAAIERSQQVISGVILARELVAAPANIVTPLTLAETATALAQTYDLALEILEQEECETRGMGAFLGVAQASDIPPKFIHLTYRPDGAPRRKLAIIGKGLTFDSGGLNLKPSGSGIEMMKTDMGGAGATFGAAKAIAQIKPDVEVHFICAATENMVSGRAMHPGDILTASNGKTIEVNNTDAEGRLTLADALVFADQLEVDAVIDLATLTGACIVALGNKMSGLWTEEETLANQLMQAAELSGEKFWRMPMEESYFEGMKSVVADMKNTGPRPGGAITAALFLKQFVKNTAWAHLDVAGPVWTDKPDGYNSAGATGFPVRTLINWVMA